MYTFSNFWSNISNTFKTTIYGFNIWNDETRPNVKLALIVAAMPL